MSIPKDLMLISAYLFKVYILRVSFIKGGLPEYNTNNIIPNAKLSIDIPE